MAAAGASAGKRCDGHAFAVGNGASAACLEVDDGGYGAGCAGCAGAADASGAALGKFSRAGELCVGKGDALGLTSETGLGEGSLGGPRRRPQCAQ
mmetsp:Transcript_60731/g.99282  ORF Transcript_60731/g.99282 Transcript_60731/m.99282 type:complete len:95 (+) Transcript_60731:389-673(+)